MIITKTTLEPICWNFWRSWIEGFNKKAPLKKILCLLGTLWLLSFLDPCCFFDNLTFSRIWGAKMALLVWNLTIWWVFFSHFNYKMDIFNPPFLELLVALVFICLVFVINTTFCTDWAKKLPEKSKKSPKAPFWRLFPRTPCIREKVKQAFYSSKKSFRAKGEK